MRREDNRDIGLKDRDWVCWMCGHREYEAAPDVYQPGLGRAEGKQRSLHGKLRL